MDEDTNVSTNVLSEQKLTHTQLIEIILSNPHINATLLTTVGQGSYSSNYVSIHIYDLPEEISVDSSKNPNLIRARQELDKVIDAYMLTATLANE